MKMKEISGSKFLVSKDRSIQTAAPRQPSITSSIGDNEHSAAARSAKLTLLTGAMRSSSLREHTSHQYSSNLSSQPPRSSLRKRSSLRAALFGSMWMNMSALKWSVDARTRIRANPFCLKDYCFSAGTSRHTSILSFVPLLTSKPRSCKASGSECFPTLQSPMIRTRLLYTSNSALYSDRQGAIDENYQSINEHNWRTSSLTETISLSSISVPSHHVHKLLSDKDSPIKQYLATKMEVLEDVHPRIKVVIDSEPLDRKDQEEVPRKRILLMSSSTTNGEIIDGGHSGDNVTELCKLLPYLPRNNAQQLIFAYSALPAMPHTISIPYQKQSVSRILSKLLPESALPPPSSYEQIGHVAHLNLRDNHLPFGKLIGSVLLDRIDSIKTVVNKLGEVGGPYRTYKVDLLAGESNYNVHVVEHGTSLYFDLTKVYWCTRLEGERTYMIQHCFKPNQVIADAFCGVGALCTRAALAKGCTILANDLNPDAVTYCRDSAQRNGIDTSNPKVFNVQCGDAREFIMKIGTATSDLPNHLVLNFPLDSPSFLNALRWWPSGEKILDPPRVHVYTFARGDEDRTASEAAIDKVADGLLPEGGYTEPSKFRGDYLNSLGCNVEAREIRDAAPGKVVICVSFSVTRVLLRRMQGDYGLL
jgi:tRNA (guanine37-N1)-methyltransferase